MAYGTLTRFDTLATAYNTTVAKFGEDLAWQAIDDALQAHNQQFNEALSLFCEDTTDRLRRYGGPDNMAMEELDEFGTPDAQKISAGATLGFPLRFYGIALQWTRLFFQNAMASELAAQITASQDADIRAAHRELKKALFVNNASGIAFLDRRVDGVSLTLRSLVNADSEPIPVAPDGSTFTASSHTHYAGATVAWTGSPTADNLATDLNNLANNVLEHFLSGQIVILINRAQEARVRTATGFTPYVDARVIQGGGLTTAVGRTPLDMTNMTNRAIGVIGAAEVWIKPWIPTGYVTALHTGTGSKVLARRTRNAGGGNLELLFDNEIYPLRARALGREHGFSVANRVAGACLYTGNTSYTNPTITA